jgi:hypothetical protein
MANCSSALAIVHKTRISGSEVVVLGIVGDVAGRAPCANPSRNGDSVEHVGESMSGFFEPSMIQTDQLPFLS